MLHLIRLDPSTPLAFSEPFTPALAFFDPWIRTEVRCHSQCAPKPDTEWIRESGAHEWNILWITMYFFQRSESYKLMRAKNLFTNTAVYPG